MKVLREALALLDYAPMAISLRGAGVGIESGSENSIGRAALRQAQQTIASVESALSPNFVRSGMPIETGAVSVEPFPATVATRVATQQSVIFWVACRG